MDCTQVLLSDSFEEASSTNEKLAVATLEVDGLFYTIYNNDNTIGRDDSCNIIIKNNTVSSKHAVIEADDPNAHLLYDAGSTNKTKLGKVTLKPHVRYHISDGDVLTFGNVSAVYNISRQYPCSPEKRLTQTVPETPEKEEADNEIIPESPPEANDKCTSHLDTSDVDMFDNEELASMAQQSILEVNKKKVEEDIYEMDTLNFEADDMLPSLEETCKPNVGTSSKTPEGDEDNPDPSGSQTDRESIYDICTQNHGVLDFDLECKASNEGNNSADPSSSLVNKEKTDENDVSIYDINTQTPVGDEPVSSNVSSNDNKKNSLEWGDFPEIPTPVGVDTSNTSNLDCLVTDKFEEKKSAMEDVGIKPKNDVDPDKRDEVNDQKIEVSEIVEPQSEIVEPHSEIVERDSNIVEPNAEPVLDDLMADKVKLKRVITDIVKQIEGSYISNRETLNDISIHPASQNNDMFESFHNAKDTSNEIEALHATSAFNDSDDEDMLNLSTQMYPRKNACKENDSFFEPATQPMENDAVKHASNESVVAIDETLTSSFFEAATQPVVGNNPSKAVDETKGALDKTNEENNELLSPCIRQSGESNLSDFLQTPEGKMLQFTEKEKTDLAENIYNAATQVFISPTTLDKSIEMCINKYGRTNSNGRSNKSTILFDQSFSSSFFEAATQPFVEGSSDKNQASSSRKPDTDIINSNILDVLSKSQGVTNPSTESKINTPENEKCKPLEISDTTGSNIINSLSKSTTNSLFPTSKEGSEFDDNLFDAATQALINPSSENMSKTLENEKCKPLEISDTTDSNIFNALSKSATNTLISTSPKEFDLDDNLYNAATQAVINPSTENTSKKPENEKCKPFEISDTTYSNMLNALSKSTTNSVISTIKEQPVFDDDFYNAATQAVMNTSTEDKNIESCLETCEGVDSNELDDHKSPVQNNESLSSSFFEAATQPYIENEADKNPVSLYEKSENEKAMPLEGLDSSDSDFLKVLSTSPKDSLLSTTKHKPLLVDDIYDEATEALVNTETKKQKIECSLEDRDMAYSDCHKSPELKDKNNDIVTESFYEAATQPYVVSEAGTSCNSHIEEHTNKMSTTSENLLEINRKEIIQDNIHYAETQSVPKPEENLISISLFNNVPPSSLNEVLTLNKNEFDLENIHKTTTDAKGDSKMMPHQSETEETRFIDNFYSGTAQPVVNNLMKDIISERNVVCNAFDDKAVEDKPMLPGKEITSIEYNNSSKINKETDTSLTKSFFGPATDPALDIEECQPTQFVDEAVEVNSTEIKSSHCPIAGPKSAFEPAEDTDLCAQTGESSTVSLNINQELCNSTVETISRQPHENIYKSVSSNIFDVIESNHHDNKTLTKNNMEITITQPPPILDDKIGIFKEELNDLYSKSDNKNVNEKECDDAENLLTDIFTSNVEPVEDSLHETAPEILSQKGFIIPKTLLESKSADHMETSMELSDSIYPSSSLVHSKGVENIGLDNLLSQKTQISMPNETIRDHADMSISYAQIVDVLSQNTPNPDRLAIKEETKVSEDSDVNNIQHPSINKQSDEHKLNPSDDNVSNDVQIQNEKLQMSTAIGGNIATGECGQEIVEDSCSNLNNDEHTSSLLIKKGRQLVSQDLLANSTRLRRFNISDESDQSSEELVIKFKKKGCSVFPPDTQDLIESDNNIPLTTVDNSSEVVNNDSQISSEEFNLKFNRKKTNVFPSDSEPLICQKGDSNDSHFKHGDTSLLIESRKDEVPNEQSPKKCNENKTTPQKSKSPAAKDQTYISRGNITLHSPEVLEELEEQFRITADAMVPTQLSVATDSESEIQNEESSSPVVRRSERKRIAKAIYKPLAKPEDINTLSSKNQVCDSALPSSRKRSCNLDKNLDKESSKSKNCEDDKDTYDKILKKPSTSKVETRTKSVKQFKKVTPTKQNRDSGIEKNVTDSQGISIKNVDSSKKESLDYNDSTDSNYENSETGEFGRGKRKRTKTSFDGFVLDKDLKKANKKSTSPSSVQESKPLPAEAIVKIESSNKSKSNRQSDHPAVNLKVRVLLHDFNKTGNSSQTSSQDYSVSSVSGIKQNSASLVDNDEDDLILPPKKPNVSKPKIVKKENDEERNKNASDTSKTSSISFSEKLDELFNIWGPADRVKLSPRAAKKTYSASNITKSSTSDKSTDSNSLRVNKKSDSTKHHPKDNKDKDKKPEIIDRIKSTIASSSKNNNNSEKAGNTDVTSNKKSQMKHKAKGSCNEEPVIKKPKKSGDNSERPSNVSLENSNSAISTRRSARSQNSLSMDDKIEPEESTVENSSNKIGNSNSINGKRKRTGEPPKNSQESKKKSKSSTPLSEDSADDFSSKNNKPNKTKKKNIVSSKDNNNMLNLENSISPTESPANDFYVMSQEFSFRESRKSIKSPIKEEFKPPQLPIRRSARSKNSEKKADKQDPEKVLFTGLPNNKLSNLVMNLGGEVVESPFTCTVLVTDKVRRTTKFLSALSRGIPIVTPAWLTSSCDAFADVNEFIVCDEEAEETYSFNLKESIAKARGRKLLDGWTVYITPSVSPSTEEMKSIIECSGGKCLTKEPARWPPNSLIISCKEDKDKWNSLMKRGKRPPIVATESLFSGILKQNLNLEEYRLI